MKYAIVFSSQSGNTRMIAEAVRKALPPEDCLWAGAPDARALEADLLLIGFWTDKGSCDDGTAAFLKTLAGQRAALFGTAGFGGAQSYFGGILDRVRTGLPESAAYLGGWMCQGKMPQTVRDRYAAMPEGPQRAAMLENFDRARSHPDGEDCRRAAEWAREMWAAAGKQ